jgi:hypothetical protein
MVRKTRSTKVRYDTTKVDVAIPLIRHAIDTLKTQAVLTTVYFNPDWTVDPYFLSKHPYFVPVHSVVLPIEIADAVNVWQLARVYICELQQENTAVAIRKNGTDYYRLMILKIAKDGYEYQNMSWLLESCGV